MDDALKNPQMKVQIRHVKGIRNFWKNSIQIQSLSRAFELSMKEYPASECSRFDEKKTFGKELYVLEINTQPGMTPLSLVPMMAKYKGISFDKLIEKIINNN